MSLFVFIVHPSVVPPSLPTYFIPPSSWQEIKSQQKTGKNRQQKTATYVLPDPSQLLPTSIPVCVPVQSSTKPSESPNPSIHPSIHQTLPAWESHQPSATIHSFIHPASYQSVVVPFCPSSIPTCSCCFFAVGQTERTTKKTDKIMNVTSKSRKQAVTKQPHSLSQSLVFTQP
jgi:hypothetical protein